MFLGTPGRLRVLGLLAAIVSLACGVLSGLAAASSAGALARAQADTEQVVRAQSITSNLLRADATATNAYLVGGTEPPTQRRVYDTAIADAAADITGAAAAQPADAKAMQRLAQQLQTYSALVEHARADNRQGLPIGQRYQQIASTGLRADALPLASAVIEANRARLGGDGRGELGWPRYQAGVQAALLVLGVGALLALSWWLARRSHRRFNPPIVAAGGLLLAGSLLGVAAQTATLMRVDAFERGALARTMALAQARTELYDARANESLALIARGSGQGYENAWSAAATDVEQALRGLDVDTGPLQAYRANQDTIRSLEKSGNWEGAVARSIDPQASGFAAVEQQLTRLTEQESARATADLGSRWPLVTLQWALPVVGVLAALGTIRGIEQRLAEYR